MLRRPPGCAAVARLAARQGVERPYRILVRMSEASRLVIARLLGCHLERGEAAELQAWRLINQNLRGLQARTHWLHETLSPFARNNNWWEILTRTARHLGLRLQPGQKDEELERRLFEHFAAEFAHRHARGDIDPERLFTELHPNLGRAIASLGLSRTGMHALVGSLLRAASDCAPPDPRDGQNRLRDWLRRAMPWTWTTSICLGLRILQQRLADVADQWARDAVRSLRGDNYARVGTALMLIHLHDVVERTLDQFDVVGG